MLKNKANVLTDDWSIQVIGLPKPDNALLTRIERIGEFVTKK